MDTDSRGSFAPREEHVEALEVSLEHFNGVPLARLRTLILVGYLALWGATFSLLLVGSLASRFAWHMSGLVGATGIVGLAAYLLITGLLERTYLFDRVRAYLLSLRLSDWLVAVGGGLLALLLLWLVGWLLPTIIGGVLGVGLALLFYFAIDRPLAVARAPALDHAQALLKSLRTSGVEESAIENFVADYSGLRWEEFYESLFGYEAKLRARERLYQTEQGRRRETFAAWRDPVIRAIEARLRASREAVNRLQEIEREGLKEQLLDASQARREALRLAQALLDQAGSDQAAGEPKTPAPSDPGAAPAGQPLEPRVIAAAKRDRQLQMLAEARERIRDEPSQESQLLTSGPLAFLLGPHLRFLAGALLLAGCVLWMKQNGIAGQLSTIATAEGTAEEKIPGLRDTFVKAFQEPESFQPLDLPVVGPYFHSFAPGVAGLILLVLGLFRGWRMTLFAWPAAATAILVPTLLGMGIAGGLALLGMVFGRMPEE